MSNKKTKKKLSLSAIMIIISLIIIIIPTLTISAILLSSLTQKGKPISGNRFKNDLDPAISSDKLTLLENDLKSMGYDDIMVDLKTATLRIYIDAKDSASEDDLKVINDKIYDKVNTILPIDTYFKEHDGKKMYDLEIHSYNYLKDEPDNNFNYVLSIKNSAMEAKSTQILSKPIDKELAAKLRGDKTIEDQNNKDQNNETKEAE